MCLGHYAQWRQGVPLRELKGQGAWGKWTSDGKGYVRRWRVDPETGQRQHQFQHRYVMEQHLCRPLLEGEEVHHINGVRDDNRLENLELWVVSQPKGQRPQDLVPWALSIIERYGSLVG